MQYRFLWQDLFQSETGEHANYEHNTNYYHHTTGHGGKGKPDPIFAQFQAIWIGIYYEITMLKASELLHEEPVSSDFVKYCARHTAAMTLQKFIRGYLVNKKN